MSLPLLPVYKNFDLQPGLCLCPPLCACVCMCMGKCVCVDTRVFWIYSKKCGQTPCGSIVGPFAVFRCPFSRDAYVSGPDGSGLPKVARY